jgi:hypothetical protein
MELINDLGTDLAVAFLIEKRYQQRLDSEEALELISRVRDLLESAENVSPAHSNDEKVTRFAH